MDKIKNDYYNSSVKYALAFLILLVFVTAGQPEEPCKAPVSMSHYNEPCEPNWTPIDSHSQYVKLVKRPNLTHSTDHSVCDSCDSGWCQGLIKLSQALFSSKYTVAQCQEPNATPMPVDPFQIPPQEQDTTPKHQKPTPLLSDQKVSYEIPAI